MDTLPLMKIEIGKKTENFFFFSKSLICDFHQKPNYSIIALMLANTDFLCYTQIARTN
jgi:hypothetical protein